MKRAWRAIERTKPVWWVALFLVLGGPTPGSVGSCSDDVSVSDPEQFCLDSQALYCLRDHEAERIDDDAYDDCLAAVTDMCEGFVWNPAVCNPRRTPTARGRALRRCVPRNG
ncbi:MAG: hypothetical protein R3A78_02110 [Polyangiales bacterium]